MNIKDNKLPWFEKTKAFPAPTSWEPSEKSQRSEEEVNKLKAEAEAKREMKRNKRIVQFKG